MMVETRSASVNSNRLLSVKNEVSHFFGGGLCHFFDMCFPPLQMNALKYFTDVCILEGSLQNVSGGIPPKPTFLWPCTPPKLQNGTFHGLAPLQNCVIAPPVIIAKEI